MVYIHGSIHHFYQGGCIKKLNCEWIFRIMIKLFPKRFFILFIIVIHLILCSTIFVYEIAGMHVVPSVPSSLQSKENNDHCIVTIY